MPTIFFDFIGVVFTNTEVAKKLFYPYTKGVTPDELQEKYERFSLGEIDEDEFLSEIVMQPNWRDKFFAEFKLNPEFCSTAGKMMETWAVYGLTNLPASWASELNERFELFHYFNGVITSSEIDARKPSEEVFEYACSEAVGECVFVERNKENVEAASKHGKAILYTKELNASSELLVVNDLRKIPELLK